MSNSTWIGQELYGDMKSNTQLEDYCLAHAWAEAMRWMMQGCKVEEQEDAYKALAETLWCLNRSRPLDMMIEEWITAADKKLEGF